jgi:hypothetical protein
MPEAIPCQSSLFCGVSAHPTRATVIEAIEIKRFMSLPSEMLNSDEYYPNLGYPIAGSNMHLCNWFEIVKKSLGNYSKKLGFNASCAK